LAIEAATGRRVDVVSGETEARLTLRGVQCALGALAGSVLTFDIGGGSTEYVLADGDSILSMASLRLGVVPLAERFPFRAPWTRALPPSVRRRYVPVSTANCPRRSARPASATSSARPER